MKKIAIVTHNMRAGGAERVIAQLAKQFSSSDIECHIIKLNNGDVFYSLPLTVKVSTIGKQNNNQLLNKFLQYIKLRKQISKIQPDVVLAMPEEVGIYTIPSLVGLKIPIIISERNNPWVMPWKKITRLMRRIFYPMASGFIFQTEQAASFFPSHIREKGIVLPNPLDLSSFPEPWRGKRRKEIVGAGRLEKQKNFPLLIRAFAKFHKKNPEYKLTIYGEGTMRGELEKLASSLLPNEAYSFPGGTSELLECMKGASIFVLSSDYEGMPNVLIEAMANGIPVVSTDCPSGGPAEIITNGVNGILVPVGDKEAMNQAMCTIVDSENLAKKLGEHALNVRERFDANIVAQQWMKYIDCVASKKLGD